MRVILIRHGNASQSSPLGDIGRWLSAHGRQQATATGRALASHAVQPTRIWTSPLVRAVQTAELVAAALDYSGEIEAHEDLYSDSPIEPLCELFGALADNETVIVVGHQPFMSIAATALLGISVSGFTTGAAYCVRLSGSTRRAELEWRWPT